MYKLGIKMKPFMSNKYYQVYLIDRTGSGHIFGVHTVVAMKYLDYYEGCVIHHEDGDPHNNAVSNLVVMSRSEHSRSHIKDAHFLAEYIRTNGPANKGKKMSPEFCQKCSISAKKRWSVANKYADKDRNSNQQ